MGERIARIKVKKEPHYLYYVKADEEGWICVYKAALSRGRTKTDSKNIIKQENERT